MTRALRRLVPVLASAALYALALTSVASAQVQPEPAPRPVVDDGSSQGRGAVVRPLRRRSPATLETQARAAEPLRPEASGQTPRTVASLVRDLWPGPIVDEFNFALPASFPATDLVESGGLLYFSFLEPAHGREL